MFVLSKRFNGNCWQAQISYVLSKTEATADNRGFGVATGISNFWKTPTHGRDQRGRPAGYDQRHELKVFASYQVPKIDLSLNAYYRYLSGIPYNALYRLNSSERSALGFSSIPSSMRTILLEPRGSRNYENQSMLDLRIEKIFKIGGERQVSVYADIANVFNTGTVDDVVTRFTGLTFGTPPVEVPFEGPLAGDPRARSRSARAGASSDVPAA